MRLPTTQLTAFDVTPKTIDTSASSQKPGVLEDIATRARLEPEGAFDATWAYEYPDEETLRRALVAPAGIAAHVGADQEDAVKAAIVEGLAPLRTADGSYRLHNEFHYLIARAQESEK